MDKNFYPNLRALLKFLTTSLQLRNSPIESYIVDILSSKDDIEKCFPAVYKTAKGIWSRREANEGIKI